MLAMLSANELRGSLSALGLDTRGSREELEARLAGAGGEPDASHGVAGAQQTPARWAVGDRVEAEFRDGHRYDATVAAVGMVTYVVFWAQPDPGDWSAELAKDKVQAYVAPSSSTDVGAALGLGAVGAAHAAPAAGAAEDPASSEDDDSWMQIMDEEEEEKEEARERRVEARQAGWTAAHEQALVRAVRSRMAGTGVGPAEIDWRAVSRDIEVLDGGLGVEFFPSPESCATQHRRLEPGQYPAVTIALVVRSAKDVLEATLDDAKPKPRSTVAPIHTSVSALLTAVIAKPGLLTPVQTFVDGVLSALHRIWNRAVAHVECKHLMEGTAVAWSDYQSSDEHIAEMAALRAALATAVAMSAAEDQVVKLAAFRVRKVCLHTTFHITFHITFRSSQCVCVFRMC